MKRQTVILATLTLGIAIGAIIAPSASNNQALAADSKAAKAEAVKAEPAQIVATLDPDISKYEWWKNRGSRFVFFAVFEGLYEDGVSRDVVDAIIPLVTPAPTDTNPAPQPYRSTDINFIYTCPLCHPASEAFLLYDSRTPFRGQKATSVDTFGSGLPAELVKKLKSDKPEVRRNALQELIQLWVQRRIERTKMTDEQKMQLTIELKLLKKAGLESLEMFKGRRAGDYYKDLYADWKTCPTCEGGFGACAAPNATKTFEKAPAPKTAPVPLKTSPIAPPTSTAPGATINLPTPSSVLAEREALADIEIFF